ncbi:Hsp20/alpha crystallin family protein [Amycolatopsis alkalitolerans]|uniref:Hsp20/alpha crystallin family protein n=1 Tax=Amycolatopsis alkalitolerans TaxID=2547244 RepID=A0A5C4M2A5_9PSEU|nr:Hsp20/alpha crystallin family protein [Amycolatopsis alkalitolerans]TNC24806.1 Hsp20/alpha crystallin family protein [Amycolatopsis alkalitolerans]
MTSLLPRPRMTFPALADWLDTGWPFGEHNIVRIEESAADGKYTVRAELPGFDPAKGIHITTEGGLLTITAEREARTETKGRSEFHYGSFRRTVSLPQGADASKITAKYADGILEVVVPYDGAEPGKPVEIEVKKD